MDDKSLLYSREMDKFTQEINNAYRLFLKTGLLNTGV